MKRLCLAILCIAAMLPAQWRDGGIQTATITGGHSIPWCTAGQILESDGSAWQCITAPSVSESDPLSMHTAGGTMTGNLGLWDNNGAPTGADGSLWYASMGPHISTRLGGVNTHLLSALDTIPAASVDDAIVESDNAWITGGWTFDPSDGGSPFSVFSTTQVVNLNADLLDGKHEPYFVHHVDDYTLDHTNYHHMYYRSLCTSLMGGNSICSADGIDFTVASAVSSDMEWDSYSPNAGGTNGLLGTWTLTNAGSLAPAVNTWTLQLTEACHTAGCGYTERAIREVLEVSVPNSTGAATLTVDGAAVLTAETDPIAAHKDVANTWTAQQSSPYPVDTKRYDPDTPPAVPNAADDEFDDGSLHARWNGGFTGWHAAAPATASESTYTGYLYVSNADTAIANYLQQDEAIAQDANFEIRCRVNQAAYGTSSVGIFAFDTNGTGWTVGRQTSSGWSHTVYGAVNTWAAPGSTAVSTYEGIAYFSIKRTASSTITLTFSRDGMVWTEVATYNDNRAIAYIGLFVNISNAGTATNPDAVTIDWFRRIS